MTKNKLGIKEHRIQIEKKYEKRGAVCEQTPKFSFTYLTTNNQYNFSFIDKCRQKDANILESAILRRLNEISQNHWKEWGALGKDAKGYETLDYSRIQFKASKKEITPDENVYIFRFKYKNANKLDGRILGIREDSCPVLEIIGFDFDYSAYKHG